MLYIHLYLRLLIDRSAIYIAMLLVQQGFIRKDIVTSKGTTFHLPFLQPPNHSWDETVLQPAQP